MIKRANNAVDDVVNIREITRHFAIAVNLNCLTLQDFLGEAEIRHVRSPPWAIDGKKPEPCLREAVKLGIGLAHQFARPLGGCVEGHWIGSRLLFLETLSAHRLVAIDRAGGGVDQMFKALSMAARLHNRQVTGKV